MTSDYCFHGRDHDEYLPITPGWVEPAPILRGRVLSFASIHLQLAAGYIELGDRFKMGEVDEGDLSAKIVGLQMRHV